MQLFPVVTYFNRALNTAVVQLHCVEMDHHVAEFLFTNIEYNSDEMRDPSDPGNVNWKHADFDNGNFIEAHSDTGVSEIGFAPEVYHTALRGVARCYGLID